MWVSGIGYDRKWFLQLLGVFDFRGLGMWLRTPIVGSGICQGALCGLGICQGSWYLSRCYGLCVGWVFVKVLCVLCVGWVFVYVFSNSISL